MRKKIVVVGSINVDLVASVQRMPVSGETIAGQALSTYPGGKGANQAVAAAKLGGDVVMIGVWEQMSLHRSLLMPLPLLEWGRTASKRLQVLLVRQ